METQTNKKENPLGYEPVGKLLLQFAVPSTISVLVNSVYNIVDQIFIGQGVGYLGNAATTVTFPIITFTASVQGLSFRGFNLFLPFGLTRRLLRISDFLRLFCYWARVITIGATQPE